jgi:RNA polymerase sigma-70 factor (ECF subfamily)
MRRYNQRLFRVARSILSEDAEAEDVVQQVYVSVYLNASQYAGRASLATWLTRITINEALSRNRSKQRRDAVESVEELLNRQRGTNLGSPEDQASRREMAGMLEAAVDALPESYRIVFVLRAVEGLRSSEVASCLDVSEEVVRVRLHRARALLRDELYRQVGRSASSVFSFAGERCDRIVAGVFARLRALQH